MARGSGKPARQNRGMRQAKRNNVWAAQLSGEKHQWWHRRSGGSMNGSRGVAAQ